MGTRVFVPRLNCFWSSESFVSERENKLSVGTNGLHSSFSSRLFALTSSSRALSILSPGASAVPGTSAARALRSRRALSRGGAVSISLIKSLRKDPGWHLAPGALAGLTVPPPVRESPPSIPREQPGLPPCSSPSALPGAVWHRCLPAWGEGLLALAPAREAATDGAVPQSRTLWRGKFHTSGRRRSLYQTSELPSSAETRALLKTNLARCPHKLGGCLL